MHSYIPKLYVFIPSCIILLEYLKIHSVADVCGRQLNNKEKIVELPSLILPQRCFVVVKLHWNLNENRLSLSMRS